MLEKYSVDLFITIYWNKEYFTCNFDGLFKTKVISIIILSTCFALNSKLIWSSVGLFKIIDGDAAVLLCHIWFQQGHSSYEWSLNFAGVLGVEYLWCLTSSFSIKFTFEPYCCCGMESIIMGERTWDNNTESSLRCYELFTECDTPSISIAFLRFFRSICLVQRHKHSVKYVPL